MAMQLPQLSDVERLSCRVIRILGGNPGKVTTVHPFIHPIFSVFFFNTGSLVTLGKCLCHLNCPLLYHGYLLQKLKPELGIRFFISPFFIYLIPRECYVLNLVG